MWWQHSGGTLTGKNVYGYISKGSRFGSTDTIFKNMWNEFFEEKKRKWCCKIINNWFFAKNSWFFLSLVFIVLDFGKLWCVCCFACIYNCGAG